MDRSDASAVNPINSPFLYFFSDAITDARLRKGLARIQDSLSGNGLVAMFSFSSFIIDNKTEFRKNGARG